MPRLTPDELAARTVGRSLLDNFARTLGERPAAIALRQAAESGWRELTWREFADQSARFAATLIARGIHRGDNVALLLRNRIEHYVADLGCLLAGAIPTSIYLTSSPEQIRWLLANCGARLVIVDGPAEMDRMRSVRSDLRLMEDVLQVTGTIDETAVPFHTWLDEPPVSWDKARETTTPSDVATVIYTSGTTGAPKAAEHTHAGLVAMAESVLHVYGENFVGKRIMSYMPLAHIAERGNSYYSSIRAGHTVTCCPDIAELPEHIRSVQPQLLFGPPRIWEKLTDEMYIYGDPSTDAAEMRSRVGLGAVEIAVTGAATLPPHVDARLAAVGIFLADMYGSTEFPSATGSPRAHRRGTVGQPCAGVEARLAPDGELELRGPAAFRRYRANAEATDDAFTEDGFVRTGDLAEIDQDGYVRLIGRKKDLIITSGGQNVAPTPIENAIAMHPLVGTAVVLGDARKYLTALVVLDPLALTIWANEHCLGEASFREVATDPDIRSEIQRHVDAVNSGLARVEQVKKIAILDRPWLQDSEEMTPTMKVRRTLVIEKYGNEIDSLYA